MDILSKLKVDDFFRGLYTINWLYLGFFAPISSHSTIIPLLRWHPSSVILDVPNLGFPWVWIPGCLQPDSESKQHRRRPLKPAIFGWVSTWRHFRLKEASISWWFFSQNYGKFTIKRMKWLVRHEWNGKFWGSKILRPFCWWNDPLQLNTGRWFFQRKKNGKKCSRSYMKYPNNPPGLRSQFKIYSC